MAHGGSERTSAWGVAYPYGFATDTCVCQRSRMEPWLVPGASHRNTEFRCTSRHRRARLDRHVMLHGVAIGILTRTTLQQLAPNSKLASQAHFKWRAPQASGQAQPSAGYSAKGVSQLSLGPRCRLHAGVQATPDLPSIHVHGALDPNGVHNENRVASSWASIYTSNTHAKSRALFVASTPVIAFTQLQRSYAYDYCNHTHDHDTCNITSVISSMPMSPSMCAPLDPLIGKAMQPYHADGCDVTTTSASCHVYTFVI
ncbi:hypothetical protein HaLaN_28977 [Haematococcus lacustris]|uniref:Uncharacterized protein n=1 Tax=Haematococcus lacustris TaxID=44745 RepID=A0A6A0ABY1_HAELA|nr:hypothetical protein HaLaN_28977 [Haematococcus lacustris]